MTTFYSEVRDLAAINYSNSFADYVQVALLPNQDSGQVVTELVQTEELTLSGTLTWNSDGSVSNAASGTSVGDTEAIALSRPVKLYYDSDFIYVLDYNRNGDDATHASIVHIRGTENGDLKIERRASENLYKFTLDWKGSEVFTQDVTVTSRSVLVFHWDGTNKTYNIYVDGVKVSENSVTGLVTDNEIDGESVTEFGVGAGGDDFYHQSLYVHPTGSFTQDELDSLISDPYQLFETAVTESDNYGLAFDSDSTKYLQIAERIDIAGADDYVVDFEVSKGTTGTIVGRESDSNRTSITINADKIRLRDLNNDEVFFTLDTTDIEHYKIARVSGVVTLEIDGVLHTESYSDNTQSWQFGRVGKGYSAANGIIAKLYVNNTAKSYLWVFDLQGTYTEVADEYNGTIATLVGFPEYAGYVYENGECVGYQFAEGTYALIPETRPNFNDGSVTIIANFRPLNVGSGSNSAVFGTNRTDGAWHRPPMLFVLSDGTVYLWFYNTAITTSAGYAQNNVDIEATVVYDSVAGTMTLFVDGSEIGSESFTPNTSSFSWELVAFARGTESSSTVVDGGVIISSINIDHSAGTNDWDFTLGDSDGTIIDTVSNNKTDVINQPTSGFLPIIEKQVYTVGNANADYASIKALEAQSNSTDHVVGLVVESHTIDSQFDMLTNDFVGGLTIIGDGEPFTGDYNDANVRSIELTNNAAFVDVRNHGLTFENLILRTNAEFIVATYTRGFHAENVGFHKIDTGGEYFFRGRAETRLRLKNCGMLAENSANSYIADANGAEYFEFYDCVVESPSNDDLFVEASLVQNCVINATGTGLAIDPSFVGELDHVIVSDSSNIDANGLNNQPISTWFTDSANDDYSINATGQAVLEGAGWDDSDIISWAYAETENANIDQSLTLSWSKFARDEVSKSLTVSWYKDIKPADISNSKSLSWSKNVSVHHNCSLSWSKTAELVDTLSLPWSKISHVNTTQTINWSKYIEESTSLSLSWSKDSISDVSKSLTTGWSKGQNIDVTHTMSWSKIGEVISSIKLSWTKAEEVFKNVTTSWSKYHIVTSSTNVKWSKFGDGLEVDFSPSWSKKQHVSEAKTISWGKQKAITSGLSLSWNKHHSLATTRTVSWSKLSTSGVLATQSLSWGKNRHVDLSITPNWSKLISLYAPMTHSWSKESVVGISDDINLDWSKRIFVGDSLTASWSKATNIQSNLTINWEKIGLFANINQPLNISWSKLQYVYSHLTLEWVKEIVPHAPIDRSYVIPYESRTYTIELTDEYEPRIYTIEKTVESN